MKVPVFIVRYAFERWDYPPFMYRNYGIYLSKSQAISEAKKLYKKFSKEETLTVIIEQQKEVYSAVDGKKLSPDFEILFRIDAFDGFHKVKNNELYNNGSSERRALELSCCYTSCGSRLLSSFGILLMGLDNDIKTRGILNLSYWVQADSESYERPYLHDIYRMRSDIISRGRIKRF